MYKSQQNTQVQHTRDQVAILNKSQALKRIKKKF